MLTQALKVRSDDIILSFCCVFILVDVYLFRNAEGEIAFSRFMEEFLF